MTKKFNELMKEYFPRGGNTKDLGVSREYLDLLLNEVIQPSPALLVKTVKKYNIPLEEAFDKKWVTSQNKNLLFFAAETLSNNKDFVKKLRRYDKISQEELSDTISNSYTSIHVPGRLSTLLTNIANYFVLSSTDDFDTSAISSSIDFNDYAGIKNPLVCLHHESLAPEKFINIKKEKKEFSEYYVNEEFLPPSIRSIKTNSDLWRPRFLEDGPRRPGVSDVDSNKVLVEYKKPINQKIIDILREEVSNSFKHPDFYPLSKGVLGSLFDEEFLLSRLNKEKFGEDTRIFYRPSISLNNDNTLIFHFYPVQILASSMKSGGGNNYWPGPGTLKLANRYQNFVEGRIRS